MASDPNEVQYCFIVEWYDAQAALVRNYQLFYFVIDNTIEMVDVKNKRLFLKRCRIPIRLQDLFINANIAVYSRQLKVVAYGDEFTRRKLEKAHGRTLGVIKPDAYDQAGKIIDTVCKNGFILSKLKMCRLTLDQAARFYGEAATSAQPSLRAQHLASNNIIVMEILGENIVEAWTQICSGNGHGDPASLRGIFATDDVRDAVHASASSASASAEIDFFFKDRVAPTAQFNNCTACVIKPHAVLAGQTGEIIDAILTQGYEISALEMLVLDASAADECMQVYQGVVPEYSALVAQMSAGPVVAMEVRGDGVVQRLRETCGPADPVIARHIRPGTLRALYGNDKVCNAVHCTDLPEDGPLESAFFFQLLLQ